MLPSKFLLNLSISYNSGFINGLTTGSGALNGKFTNSMDWKFSSD